MNNAQQIIRIKEGQIQRLKRHTVCEYPLRLRVNGEDLATLICSPYQIKYLLIGFFLLQGFIESTEDILALDICHKYGLADIHIQKELPEKLQPTLTSGCGTGIAYNLPCDLLRENNQQPRDYDIGSLLQLMQHLHELTKHYRSHGGIHSAAIGDPDGTLLLHAEDIGRHNTFDRVAGEALFLGVDLRNKMLVTSGRISTEMVAKAAKMGVGLVASRTSPTDKAIKLCQQAGITLVGYVRGENMDIFTHPQQLGFTEEDRHISGVTGVILAGGQSRRMGSDKALLPLTGARFIDHVYRSMADLFDEVILVTNTPGRYASIPCRKVTDIYPAQGPLAGIHAGLFHATHEKIFVAACDMPFIIPGVVKAICSQAEQGDVILPYSSHGHQPLHALYGKTCLPAIKKALDAGKQRITAFFDQVSVARLAAETMQQQDPEEKSFQNINTPEEYSCLRTT